jgi:hypothetical protein
MNLNDIIQGAQGGAGLQNLATQFGLSPEQTQAAVQAIIPALSHGLQRAAQDPGALQGVVNEIGSGAHAGSYADPSQTAAAANAGTGALGQIFGGPGVTNQISQQISNMSGLSPAIIGMLLPAVTSMVMGGLAHTMNQQGQGATLNPGAASGGGGFLGSLVSMVTGGGGAQGGLGSLISMFEPGMSVPAGHAQALNDILPR